ncbi:hypothetical protein VTJ83DRAFT_1054 [Remersonia thermophila]|uniref:intramembrane prenyl-peptidase Rce1 n=1 Tax=Remersonia thermophila TaxID=72144 RepID=A0ABR4DN39_9PEZI
MPAIADALRRLNPWHKDAPPPPPPPITPLAASLVLVLYALGYFVPFYLSPATRPSPTLSRDAPSVIRARVRSVVLSSLLCTAATYAVLARLGGSGPREALHLLGLWPLAARASLRALGLTALLFLGPLYGYLVVDRGWRDWLRLEPVKELWREWTAWRNYVAGPITEELLFRAASLPLLLLARCPPSAIVLCAPLTFGLAHVHHYYEFRLTHPRVPAAAALARSLFQLAYTTLFGAYASFLFLRTGSLLAVSAVHAFCNGMGLPQVYGRVEPAWDGDGDDDGGGGGRAGKRPSILWSVVYYVLLVAGAVLWYRNLWGLSESGNALVPAEAFSKASSSS